MLKPQLLCMLALVLSACIVRKEIPIRGKFVTFDQRGFFDLNILLRKIDKPKWVIGYRFGTICPAAFRQKEKELTTLTIEVLKAWLKPLHKLSSKMAITADFQLVRQKDYKSREDDRKNLDLLLKLDTRVTFTCEVGRSGARITRKWSPDVDIKSGLDINTSFTHALTHELGHAFGLVDTYVDTHRISTGGITRTWGMQPSSIMASLSEGADFPPYLKEDDKKGIIWLYKYLYERQSIDDCFFSDYVFEEETRGCRPRYPLIYEAKHSGLKNTAMILIDDPALELNGRDSQGMTALHYAVARGDAEMVKLLLAQAGIKVNLLNKHRRTPAQLARVLKQVHLAKMIEAHPTAKHNPQPWSVDAKGKKPVTWGELKRGDH